MKLKNPFFRLINTISIPKKLLVFTIAIAVMGNVLSLFIPLLTGNLVDSFISNNGLNFKFIIFFLVIFFLNSVAGGIGLFFLTKVSEKVVYSIRDTLWTHIIHLETTFFDYNESGSLISRLIDDAKIITSFISDKLPNFFPSIITIVGSLIILFIIDWKMSLLIVIVIPFYLISMMVLGSKMRVLSIIIQNETSNFSANLGRVLNNIRLVKISNKEYSEVYKTQNNLKNLYSLGIKEGLIKSIIQPISGIIMLTSIGIILTVGGIRVSNGDITTGSLISLVFYILQMTVPFITLSTTITEYKKTVGASERLYNILTLPTISNDIKQDFKLRRETLSFKNVEFSYKEENTIKNLTFSIKPNEFVALVGPSGSGKTTIFSLIERLYEPTEGQILYGTDNIANLPLFHWRDHLGYVMQNNNMMNGTIRENLLYASNQNISDDLLDYYCKLANCYDFIYDLPNTYDTTVGEQGLRLSGGQKQRIDIARNLIKNPSILLLDEATSSLDSQSEKMIQNTLFNLITNRTILVIAHRLSTIEKADKIIFLDNGKITGTGTHKELLKSHRKYNQFVNNQQTIH
ncbi:ABC transporter ATP-binding protein [Staphylococcus ureilyticus]|uniref:ABC transporter ATP-binding protein n=1 Tax=Staphylococcus ureilyticus TaxID=94138 RepID=UPI00195A51A8|nr:ABC transporter ATP-binding protein [Staphylococcus ureilyticus]MBM9448530.1 ABC transporter ATP-binding protein [Staphylococcus ureilyticus]